jgi:hypothetical protein
MARHKKKRKHPSNQTSRTVSDSPKGTAAAPKCDSDLDSNCEDMEVEHYFAVEWGERLESSKAIARGGKSNGYVPGASAQFP